MIELPMIERLHNTTTLFHAFIYFSPEAAAHYKACGLTGRSQYFASRTAAMGPLAPEPIVATFYNFSPDVVLPACENIWDITSPAALQVARWRGAAEVLDRHVAPVMEPTHVEEAIELCENAVSDLAWAGRPIAAANAAVLRDLTASELGHHRLVQLWQLVTVMREWRGDAHIGLLVAAPLDGPECTVVTDATAKLPPGVLRTSRGWSEDDWNAAVNRLEGRGWIAPDGSITDHGRSARAGIEEQTNALSLPMGESLGADGVNRLHELLAPASRALLAANYFAAMGRPAAG